VWQRLLRRLPRRYEVELAVCAIFRNEGRYLDEWIDFHRSQGAERFYLYDNRSTDRWISRSDDVEVQAWPDRPGQLSAYSHCLETHWRDTRWMAFLDVDEFLFSPTGRPLPEILSGFRWVAGVCASWRVYGTSGHEEPVTSVIDSYLWRAREDHPLNRHVKSVVRPRLTLPWPQTPHVFRHHGRAVDENGIRVTGPLRHPPTAKLLRINHYITRSRSEWESKVSRQRADTAGTHGEPRLPPDEILDPILRDLRPAPRNQAEFA
jgi:hypothetical protein